MNTEAIEAALAAISVQLERIAAHLEGQQPERLPSHRASIAEFPVYDWAAIGARVVQADEDGPTHVQAHGRIWARRASAKNGPEVWFSASLGGDESGRADWHTLIKFSRLYEPDRLPRQVREQIPQPVRSVEQMAHQLADQLTRPPASVTAPDRLALSAVEGRETPEEWAERITDPANNPVIDESRLIRREELTKQVRALVKGLGWGKQRGTSELRRVVQRESLEYCSLEDLEKFADHLTMQAGVMADV